MKTIILTEEVTGSILWNQLDRALKPTTKRDRKRALRRVVASLHALEFIPSSWKTLAVGAGVAFTGERVLLITNLDPDADNLRKTGD